MDAIATTSYGRLEGVDQGRSLAFKGVPYAHPPVGEMRFAGPIAPVPWDGVRQATAYAAAAPQVPNPALDQLLPAPDEAQDEDCLYLNVWTPALDARRRPVLFWIHGGGFTLGSGSSAMYDGTALVERGDVVVVTINYRLGTLGFLSLPGGGGHVPRANFGMLDQLAALRWVRDEIVHFGGDPGNVTIFGESAGGMSVGALMGSRLSTGLFRRAIAQSGAGHNALSLDEAATTAQRFRALTGVDLSDLAALRSLPTEKILDAQAAIEADLNDALRAGLPPRMPFQPVIDGYFLESLPVESVDRGVNPGTSLLVGSTGEESKLFTAMAPGPEPDAGQLAAAFAARLGERADSAAVQQTIDTYRRARSARGEPATHRELIEAVDTDFMFRIPADRLATAHAARQPDTYAYRFDWTSPMADGALGACHALEIPFVFGNQRLPGLEEFAGSGPAVDRLAEQVMDAWLAFAREGNPSTEALTWPPFDAKSRRTAVLDASCRIEERPREPERQCWEGRR
jgi:para-nitrobenzyl esterase